MTEEQHSSLGNREERYNPDPFWRSVEEEAKANAEHVVTWAEAFKAIGMTLIICTAVAAILIFT